MRIAIILTFLIVGHLALQDYSWTYSNYFLDPTSSQSFPVGTLTSAGEIGVYIYIRNPGKPPNQFKLQLIKNGFLFKSEHVDMLTTPGFISRTYQNVPAADYSVRVSLLWGNHLHHLITFEMTITV